MEETASYSSPSCGEIEYVLSGNQLAGDDTEPNTTSMYDFVEIIDSELVVYCDWYTQETGSFEVSVAARLKWFASEMSTPVTFQIMLNQNCNKRMVVSETPEQKQEAIQSVFDSNDQVFSYGEIVLVLALFIVSTFLGAAIAFLFISPVNASTKVANGQQGRDLVATTDNVTITGASIS